MKQTNRNSSLLRSLVLLLGILVLVGLISFTVFATGDRQVPAEAAEQSKTATTETNPPAPGDERGMGIVPYGFSIRIPKFYYADPQSKPKVFSLNVEYHTGDGKWAPATPENGFYYHIPTSAYVTPMKPDRMMVDAELIGDFPETMYIRITENIPEEPDGIYYDRSEIVCKIKFDANDFISIEEATRNGKPYDPETAEDGFFNYSATFLTETLTKELYSYGKDIGTYGFNVEQKVGNTWVPLSDAGYIRLVETPSVSVFPSPDGSPTNFDIDLAFLYGIEKEPISLRITEKKGSDSCLYDSSECILNIDFDAQGNPYVVSRTQNGKAVNSFKFVNRDALPLIVEKKVTGAYADTTRQFKFKLVATAPAGYTGPMYTVASNSDVSVDNNGVFYLKHGQALRLENISFGTIVSVVEEKDAYCDPTIEITCMDEGYPLPNLSENPWEAMVEITDHYKNYIGFTNAFNTEPAVDLTIHKDLIGSATKLSEFKFILERWDGGQWVAVPKDTGVPHYTGQLIVGVVAGTSASTALKLFPDPNQQGEAKYRVREVIDSTSTNVRYDSTIYTFSVVKDSNGYFKLQNLSSGAGPATEIRFKNYTAHTIQVKKIVSGNMADPLDGFSFKIEVLDVPDVEGDPYVASGAPYWAGTYELSDGDTLTLSNLPYGTKLRITEETNGGYTTSIVVNVDGKETTTNSTVTELTVGAGSTTVTYHNRYDMSIETGVVLESLPYVLILVAVTVGGFFFLRKRKENQD